MINRDESLILRTLAKKVSEIADLPIMKERQDMWVRHNRLERVRPMILVFPEGSWRELLPESVLQCESPKAREIEWELRRRIFQHEFIDDDAPIEKNLKVHKIISGIDRDSIDLGVDWGIEIKRQASGKEGGAFGFEQVLKDYSDIKRLKVPELIYDEKATLEELDLIQETLGDILDVRLKGIIRVYFHFMYFYTAFRGLEQMMYDLMDEPGFVHEVLTFLENGYQSIIKQCIDQNLFSLNNDDTYHSSGGLGYSTEIPANGYDPGHILPRDIWASAESQEMAQISPAQHQEFAMQYEKRILSQFALNGYGCCDPLHDKMEFVTSIPNMRRISISPWADVRKCAEKLKSNFIYSWKPHPVLLSGPDFEPENIREYMKNTFDVTRDCVIEMILADTHTCQNQPERFTKWVKIARELTKDE